MYTMPVRNQYLIHQKRVLDVLLASVFLFCALPLLCFLTLLIKRDSPGPVIFRQLRVGQYGRKYIIYKLRTMRIDTPAYMPKPDMADPRITRIGWFLRYTCLDELPQLINVLKGDMSLVGPRPLISMLVDEDDPKHMMRAYLKPGMTGVWQLSTLYGHSQDPISKEALDLDLGYLDQAGPWFDVKIIFLTLWELLRRVI